MKNAGIKVLFTIFAMTVFFAITVIAVNELYYKNVFPMGIWINDVYCTGMTPQEVINRLDSELEKDFPVLSVHMADGTNHRLNLDEYGVTASYQASVEKIYNENKGYLWIKNLKLRIDYKAEPEYIYDVLVMEAKLDELEWLNENVYSRDNTVSIVKSTSAGYVLVDETGDLLLRDKVVKLICEGIVNQLTDIDLSTDENKKLCYKSIPYTAQMKDTLEKWQGIEKLQSFNMLYIFGDRQEKIDASVTSDWLALDDNGNIIFDENNVPVIDKSMIEEYVAYLSASYDTVGIEREFRTTSGKLVTVSGGDYGNAIDTKAEYEFLLNAFLNGESGTRIPEYKTEVWEKGEDDIGNTYVEVDMGEQHMYYYKDGELIIDTPVVTGNLSRGWDTPAKICYVYFKQKNRVLRGKNYATPVKYWMAVDGNIGIHDATWRKEFGGDIYLTNGSHGCINTPLEVMSTFYETVEKGTPVILFY